MFLPNTMESNMKKISYIALAAVLATSGFALPAFAATTAALSGQVPACQSSTAQQDLKDGVYASDFQQRGLNIQSLEIWNGCVKVIYNDASGNSGTAIYDPDTLQLLMNTGAAVAPTG
jgi:hypothetical protein